MKPLESILVVPDIGDREENLLGAEDLAWEHAKSFVDASGMELGSEAFVAMYQHLATRYTDIVNNLGFIQNFSLRIVAQMLESGHSRLSDTATVDQGTVTEAIVYLAHIVGAGLMSAIAGERVSWINNDEWETMSFDERGVLFEAHLFNGGK